VFYTHFNLWQWVKALANVFRQLVDASSIQDETHRVHSILMRKGFKGILAEVVWENRVVLDMFSGHDSWTGNTRRVIVD